MNLLQAISLFLSAHGFLPQPRKIPSIHRIYDSHLRVVTWASRSRLIALDGTVLTLDAPATPQDPLPFRRFDLAQPAATDALLAALREIREHDRGAQ